jgi:hypothetical protein
MAGVEDAIAAFADRTLALIDLEFAAEVAETEGPCINK